MTNIDYEMLVKIKELCVFVIERRNDNTGTKTRDEAFDIAFDRLEAKYNADDILAWTRKELR